MDSLFKNKTPLIDVRSEVEFDRGTLPYSRNLPILRTTERIEVGTCYKTEGPEAAIRLGHSLVSGVIKEERIHSWVQFAQNHPGALLYCARGGLRSKIAAEWLRERAVFIERIPGGYKTLRNHLLARLQEISPIQPFWILGGSTGSGKTRFLLSQPGPFIDLEALARHKGSSFGGLGDQPSQATFENGVASALIEKQGRNPVLLEDESIMIGSRIIPEILFAAMKRAPLLLLERSIEARTLFIFEDYVLHRLYDPLESLKFFKNGLFKIQKKLGGLETSRIQKLLESAFTSPEATAPEAHLPWIRALLEKYYDPLYSRSIERNSGRIVVRGGPEIIESWIQKHLMEDPK